VGEGGDGHGHDDGADEDAVGLPDSQDNEARVGVLIGWLVGGFGAQQQQNHQKHCK
jgi:hypothetical protein